jgi:hypothetical protein
MVGGYQHGHEGAGDEYGDEGSPPSAPAPLRTKTRRIAEAVPDLETAPGYPSSRILETQELILHVRCRTKPVAQWPGLWIEPPFGCRRRLDPCSSAAPPEKLNMTLKIAPVF